MPLSIGERLGHYNVTALIGEGGMGQVYQATDTKLHRQVALKILPEAFASDPDRLARFQREAQVLASLNHPNIAAIHGLEDSEGTKALVLELVEGPTLADRIAQGPIPIDEALPIAKQIAEALEAAHEAGVIHRDLKPANIKVKDDGTVKVLDFGLAKALGPVVNSDPSLSPTLTARATQMGMIMGTAAYMSPEQARGKEIDPRTDIWSFGVVFYEMLTAQRAFAGDDVSTTLAKVLERDPTIDALPANLPGALSVFLRRCLVKNPAQRLQAIGDMRLAMEGAFEVSGGAVATPDARGPASARHLGLVGLCAVALAVGAGFAGWVLRSPVPQPVSRLAVSVRPSRPVAPTLNSPDVAVSPDGAFLIYQTSAAGAGQFDVRRLDQLESIPLRGTEGAAGPFVSPDGEWVGFQRGAGGPLQRVSVLGGPAVTICDLPADLRGASWGPDDTIVFGINTTSTLFQVPAGGGEAMAISQADGRYHVFPDVLPQANGVLFTLSSTNGGNDDDQVAVLDLETGQHRVIIDSGSAPRYLSTGHVVYAVGGTLQAVLFDATRLEVTGAPVPVVEGVSVKPSGAASFAVSETGALAYVSGATGVGRRIFAWVDREGRGEPLPLPPRAYANPRLSPDGTRIAATVAGETNDLWVYEASSGAGQRLTLGEGNVNTPVWTPDGTRVVFTLVDDSGTFNIHVVPADGSGMPERLMNSEQADYPTSVSPDGRTVLFIRIFGGLATPHREIWEVSLDGEQEATPLLQGEFARGNAEYSPDGRWIVYRSDQSGIMQVFAQPYPGPGPTVPLSIGGGEAVTWSPDGSQLFYRLGSQMMAIAVDTSESFDASPPVQLFEEPYYGTPGGVRQYHVTPDGGFLMLQAAQADTNESPTQVVLVQNWHQELLERVPVN